MSSDMDLSKKKKKTAGPWTIGWGWFITVPAIFWLIKSSKKVLKVNGDSVSPLDIIKMRYAKGEIDREIPKYSISLTEKLLSLSLSKQKTPKLGTFA